MRHITDGELHAYLDGALDYLPEERGQEVRRHLEECSACRERLQDEGVIRDRAQGILDQGSSGSVSAPPFEELRARAGSAETRETDQGGASRRGPLRGLPLAWAATIVLALGVGWMGGKVWNVMPQREYPAPGVNPALLPNSPRASDLVREQAEQEEEPTAVGLSSSAEPPEPSAGREEAVPPAPGGEAEGKSVEDLRTPSMADEAALLQPPLTPSPTVVADPTAVQRQEARIKGDVEALTVMGFRGENATRALEPPAPTGLDLDARVDREGIAVPEWEVAGGEASLAVPGLELLEVKWESLGTGEQVLHIRQRLPGGDLLELRYFGLLVGSRAAVFALDEPKDLEREEGLDRLLSPKVLEASLPPGWNQVVMHWNRGLLVARAPLSEESLRGILLALR